MNPKYKNIIHYCYEADLDRNLDYVCRVLGIPRAVVVSASKAQEASDARHVFFRYGRSKGYPVKMIGDMVGRSHSVVINGSLVAFDVESVNQKYLKCFCKS